MRRAFGIMLGGTLGFFLGLAIATTVYWVVVGSLVIAWVESLS